MLATMALGPLFTLASLLVSAKVGGAVGVLRCALAGSSITLACFLGFVCSVHLAPWAYAHGGVWFSLSELEVGWELQITPWSQPVVGAVLLVSWVVVAYSGWYISGDPQLNYFMALVQGFVFFMLCLLLAGSTPLLFLGWEGIGVLSFFLIAFWQTRTSAAQASMQGFITNRAGDTALILAIAVAFASAGLLELDIFTIPGTGSRGLVGYLVLGGAAGKSAQLGLHAWLPSAIEAPTPVSSLIHAATLVTAGVYLLVRTGGNLTQSGSNGPVLIAGAVTLLLAGFVGVAQTDLKRTIAFSTCSQVGYMVLGVGNGASGASLFLLFTHALYKALLFMCAGIVIHSAGNNQDVRLLGATGMLLPVSKQLFAAASLTLCALPFSAGDFSKDLLMEEAGYSYLALHQTVWVSALVGTVLTGAYSARLLSLVYAGEPRAPSLTGSHETPLLALSVLTILGGIAYSSGILGLELFNSSLAGRRSDEIVLLHNCEQGASVLPTMLPLGSVVLGLVIGTCLSLGGTGRLSFTAYHQARWETTVPRLVSILELKGSAKTFKALDSGSWELLGPRGLALTLWQPLTQQASRYAQATAYQTIAPLAFAIGVGALYYH